MKYSGMTRPEVEERAPKRNVLPSIPAKILGEVQAALAVGDEVAFEVDVLRPLCNRFGARNGVTSLDSGVAAKPGKLNIVVGEGGDRGRIALYRYIFDRYTELLLEIFGKAAESLDETCLVLIRDRRKHESGRLRSSSAYERRHQNEDPE